MVIYSSTVINNAVEHNKSERERLSKDITTEVKRLVKKQLADDDINFTEDLSNSFELGIEDNGFATVQTSNRYAGLVDAGTPAGTKVNFDALRYWVENKLGVSPNESTNVTFKIYQKIISTGIQPKRYMKKAIKIFIGKHGKISVYNKITNRKKKSRLQKILGKAFKHIKAISKALKDINRTVKKITKPINKARKQH